MQRERCFSKTWVSLRSFKSEWIIACTVAVALRFRVRLHYYVNVVGCVCSCAVAVTYGEFVHDLYTYSY